MSKRRASEPGTSTSFSFILGTETYRVSPGLASELLKVMRLKDRGTFMAPKDFAM